MIVKFGVRLILGTYDQNLLSPSLPQSSDTKRLPESNKLGLLPFYDGSYCTGNTHCRAQSILWSVCQGFSAAGFGEQCFLLLLA